MPIKKITLPLNPRSKPRGHKGKYGNINHSQVEDKYGTKYIDWQNKAIKYIKEQWPYSNSAKLQGLIVVHYVSDRRSDLDNLVGAVFDLSSKTIVKDDRLGSIPRLYTDHVLVNNEDELEQIKIVLIYNEKNWQQVYFQEIGKILEVVKEENVA